MRVPHLPHPFGETSVTGGPSAGREENTEECGLRAGSNDYTAGMEAQTQSLWTRRMDLPAATSPEMMAHQNTSPVGWEATSPCADEMQTDSPSNVKTPVPEGRHGMEVSTFLQFLAAALSCLCLRDFF